jgi:mannose/cellobiose epimerase-like protein (N-acyl-D-glucosamine 2-epimerase family)
MVARHSPDRFSIDHSITPDKVFTKAFVLMAFAQGVLSRQKFRRAHLERSARKSNDEQEFFLGRASNSEPG